MCAGKAGARRGRLALRRGFLWPRWRRRRCGAAGIGRDGDRHRRARQSPRRSRDGTLLLPGRRLASGSTPPRSTLALKALYASGLFEDVRISQSGGRLIVTVVEAPVIDRLAFEGNCSVKDEQLQQEIQSEGTRHPVARHGAGGRPARSSRSHHRNGRFDVTVVPKIIQRPNNRVDLVFEVNGRREDRDQVHHLRRQPRLFRLPAQGCIKTSESNWLSFLQTTDVYDADRIEADRDLIRRYYLSHGYADVQVVSATGEYDPSRKGFIITFTIEEGVALSFRRCRRPVRISAPSTRRRCGPSCGRERAKSTTATRSKRSVEEVTVEIARHGYPFATVTSARRSQSTATHHRRRLRRG